MMGLCQKVKQVVESVLIRVSELSSSQHIEVQERVSIIFFSSVISSISIIQAANVLQIFSFIQADLNSYRPWSDFSSTTSLADSARLDDLNLTDELRFPKSLYIISPLTNTHELNPVATNAQASVPVPEGLDLDS